MVYAGCDGLKRRRHQITHQTVQGMQRLTVFGLETEEFPDVICRDVDHRVIDTAYQKSKEIVGTAAAWEDAISLMKRVSTKPSCVWNTETVISFNCSLKLDIK